MEKIRKVLVIICTCNPNDGNYNERFEDFSYVWFDVIRSWQMQRSDELYVDIVVVDNVSGPKTRAKLIEFQKQEKDFHIDFVDEWFTSQFVCFNHALSLFKDKDNYAYYAYCASDAYFRNKGDLQILLDDMDEDENCCFISPYADYDIIQRLDFDRKKPPTRVRLGEAVNNHLAIWTREFMEAYNYKYVDILGGNSTETFYPYICAAIKCHESLSHRVCIHHLGVTDRRLTGSKSMLIPQYKIDFFNMLEEGAKIGLGFEEVSENYAVYKNVFLNNQIKGIHKLGYLKFLIIKYIALTPIFRSIFNSINSLNIIPKKITNYVEKLQGKPYVHRHNPDCFDENGYAKTDDLYHFIKENLFLKRDELDYETIRYQIIIPD